MGIISFQVILLIFLHLSLPIFSTLNGETTSKSLDFLKTLHGSQKGAKAEGVSALKNYLRRFGYLSDSNQTNINNLDVNEFDGALENALKSYQQYFKLDSTGTVDSPTLKQIQAPRCGVPDKDGGLYTFIGSRWPANKTRLTYAFLSQRKILAKPCSRAFRSWSKVSRFRFKEAENYDEADIKISFQVGDHGDGRPFDGPYNVLAHATPPTNTIIHFDGAEKWSNSPMSGSIDLESVALHEIGHTLGLNHSPIKEAIMFPILPVGGSKRGLNQDDIEGLRALYGG